MPPGLIQQQHRMPTWLDHPRDLGQVQAHSRSVAEGQNQSCALAITRADGAKDVGRCTPLVLRR